MEQSKINNLDDMLKSESYQIFESGTLLNIQYHCVNNTYDIDIDNMIKANNEGNFGVTHSDFIQCWKEYLDSTHFSQKVLKKIESEINKTEKWHKLNNSLYQEI